MRRSCCFVLIGLLIVSTTGCKKSRTASVSGRVYFDTDKPLPFGQVQFMGEGGSSSTSPISPDGRYNISGLPTGKVKILVSTKQIGSNMAMMPGMPGGGGPPGMPGGGGPPGSGGPGMPKMGPDLTQIPKEIREAIDNAKIDEKYSTMDKSELSYEVTSGSQTYDIYLK